MQLVANQALVKNRVRLGLGCHLAALAVFAVGLFISLNVDVTRDVPYLAWPAILVGLILYALGQTQLRRWGPRNRQEEPFEGAIRGLDDRYKLYAFLSSSMPDYILVSPAGVQVLIPRLENGKISCTRDRWNRASNRLVGFFGQGFGNPSADAARQVQQLQKLLSAAGIEDVPTSAIIVFVDNKVQLRVEGCSATVTRLAELKDVLRRKAGKGQNVALTQSRVREVQKVFDERMRAARSWR
jgi:hypothetical protein